MKTKENKIAAGMVEIAVRAADVPLMHWFMEAPASVRQWYHGVGEALMADEASGSLTEHDPDIQDRYIPTAARLWRELVLPDAPALAWANANMSAWLRRMPRGQAPAQEQSR